MEQKTYIGLTPTKEMEEVKSGLRVITGEVPRRIPIHKEIPREIPKQFVYGYVDEDNLHQLRVELWEELEESIITIKLIGSLKNDIREGEEIKFYW